MNRHLKHSRLGASMMAVALMSSCMIEAEGAATPGAAREPVEYRVKEKSLIGNQIHEAGAIVKYDGLPADNLEPLCDVGRARAAEYEESNRARIANLVASHKESAVGNPEDFVKQFAKILAEERAEHAAQMAKMVELQQQSATQLAEAAKNMALLAASLTQPQAAAPAADPGPSTDTATDTAKPPADAEDKGTDGTAPAKRTRGG